jgi:isoleucyl-tRNA synthetase
VSDRIRLWWQAAGDVAEAMREHAALVAEEVLAVEVSEGSPGEGLDEYGDAGLGLRFWLSRA